MAMTRRNFLKSLGLGALGLSVVHLNGGLVRAQTSPAPQPLGGVFQFRLGDWDMMVIKDTNIAPSALVFAANQPEEDALDYFRERNVLNEDGTINALVDILVARNGDETIVFDTGFGADGPGGQLVATLEALGIAPADVTRVVSTHFHPDHISGLSSEGALTFPNAQVFFSQAEFNFLEAAPEEVAGGALSKLQPALDADAVSFYQDEGEVAPGVMAMAAFGHTPGHSAMMLESNGARLLNMVDTTLNLYAHVPNPTWHSQFDADPEMAVETRTRIMGMAADENIPVFGYHFPFPGIGYLDRDGEGFRFTPVAF